jgi:branched-chain amino acid transport system ATP-binding protein
MSFVNIAERSPAPVQPISLLSLDRISKHIGGRSGVSDLSFSIRGGEIVGLIGRKGAGKSVILDIISGYMSPNSGRIFFAGQDVTELPLDSRQQRGLARSVEAAGVFPDFTLAENVVFGGSARRQPHFPRTGGKSCDAEAQDLLGMIGLAGLAESPAGGLTAQQRRILGIAAALASKPSLLLVDLSPEESHEDRMGIASLLARVVGSGVSVLVTSHHMCPIIAMCDRAALLSDGRIVAEDAPSRILDKTAALWNHVHRLQ